MNEKHTPCPWETDGVEISGPRGEHIGSALDGLVGLDECAANAAFIVRAVNCHADLVAALRSIADKAGEMADSPDTAQRGLWQGCAEEARAALATAEPRA